MPLREGEGTPSEEEKKFDLSLGKHKKGGGRNVRYSKREERVRGVSICRCRQIERS